MAAAADAGALSDVDEDPILPPTSSSTSSKPPPQPNPILDLTAELEEERRLRRAAEDALAASETLLGRLKAVAQDALRKRDDQSAAARALAALQAEAATATSMLASGLDRISAKASPATPPAPLPTSAKYSAGLPALAYGVLKRANEIVDDLQAQISAEKDEVYTLTGALENSIKDSQIKIIELQHLAEAKRAESGLLRTRMEGQEKEIGQLRKQIKHLEEKERVANDSVEGLMMDVTAAEEEIKRWKMAAEEEAEAGRSIQQEFQIQLVENSRGVDLKTYETMKVELQNVKATLRRNSLELDRAKNILSEREVVIKDLDEKLAGCQSELGARERKLNDVEKKLDVSIREKEDSNKENKSLLKQIEDLKSSQKTISETANDQAANEKDSRIQLSPKLTDQISALTTGLINLLNTGSLEDLQKLKGIKAQRAASIIKHRGSCAFEKIADLRLRDIEMKEKEIEAMLSALVWTREDN